MARRKPTGSEEDFGEMESTNPVAVPVVYQKSFLTPFLLTNRNLLAHDLLYLIPVNKSGLVYKSWYIVIFP